MSGTCFECKNKNSYKCLQCGIAKDGSREFFEQKPITNADRIRAMTDEPIIETEFMTHNQGQHGFEIHFRTDDKAKYEAVQDECRRQIGHAKPAADVRPVVRGKWLPDYDEAEYDFDGSTLLAKPRVFQDGWQCSLCGGYMPSETNFCPNCGADMREES